MAKPGQNKPPDFNFTAEKLNEPLGERAKNHDFVDGEYVAKPYIHQPYPKMKYHPEYVHEQKDGIVYGFTECAQQVSSEEEEKALGQDWKDSPAAFGIVTAPDTRMVGLRRLEEAKQSGQWRKGANIPKEQVTEKHLEFAQANGVPNLETLGDLYGFLAKLSSAQMRDFMKEAAEWIDEQEPEKRGPGRPRKLQEATA